MKSYDAAPIAAWRDDSAFIEATREPLHTRNLTRKQQKLWAHVIDQVAGAMTGEGSPTQPRRGEPYASVTHALQALLARHLDGARVSSMGDPERLKRLVFLGPQPPGAAAGRWQEDSDLFNATAAAIARAFEPLPETGGRMGREECTESLIRRYAMGETTVAIAERLQDRLGSVITPRTVGRVTRYGHQAVYEHLRSREIVPCDATEGSMQKPGGDLRGWKAIADYMSVSVATVQRWTQNDGLPVYVFMGNAEAHTHELTEWRNEQTQPMTPRSKRHVPQGDAA